MSSHTRNTEPTDMTSATDTIEKTADLWVCDDCLMWIANADLSGLDYRLGSKESAQQAEKIRQGERDLRAEYGQLHVGDQSEEFSSALCDCCGSLPGPRHLIAAYR